MNMKRSDFDDRSRYEVVTVHLILADKRGPDGKSAVAVKVYKDVKSGRAYQVDDLNGEYRESRHVIEPYGEWKKLG